MGDEQILYEILGAGGWRFAEKDSNQSVEVPTHSEPKVFPAASATAPEKHARAQ